MSSARQPVRVVRRSLQEGAVAARAVRRSLLEYAQGGKHTVDREHCIIRGVKVLGRTSRNRHKIEDVTEGTEYTPEAMAQAVPLYEGAMVNVDHPPRDKPRTERSALDRVGKLFNVRATDDGVYADLKLIPSHPMTPRLLDVAESEDMSDCFGLSHNASGIGEVRNGKYIVTEIPEVKSVDVVANAGSVTSLFESEEPPVKTLKDHLSKLKGRKAKTAAVLELLEDDGYGDMSPVDPGEEGTMEDHLCNAVTAILKDSTLSMEDKKKKVVQVMKTMDEEEEPAPAPKKVEEDDEEEEEVKECDEEDGKKTMKESLEILKRKDKARDLCEDANVSLAGADGRVLLEALVNLPNEAAMKRLIDREAKQAKASDGKGKGRPRTQALTESADDATEVGGIKDGKSFAAALRRLSN